MAHYFVVGDVALNAEHVTALRIESTCSSDSDWWFAVLYVDTVGPYGSYELIRLDRVAIGGGKRTYAAACAALAKARDAIAELLVYPKRDIAMPDAAAIEEELKPIARAEIEEHERRKDERKKLRETIVEIVREELAEAKGREEKRNTVTPAAVENVACHIPDKLKRRRWLWSQL